ncbi:Spy/CpxP family protein refolding chaperone [Psychromonas aquimarina]|uniref:Spy/CpxP family protein refolding chaperone n=1 Tax=Psychromonas aquimarina TaxID=444919 RepID=UPI0003FE65FC|nr:Spy/CpxP family protein refolding chaperone [Psychromonas aquimarina]
MNSLLKKVLLASVIIPLTFSTAYAKSGGKGGHHGMPFKGMLKQVDLTPEQQADIKIIMQNYRSDKKMQSNNRGTFHERQMAIMKASDFDEAQAGALIDDKNALRKEAQLKRMQMTFDIYHSLTPEQQGKMDLLFEQHQQKMQEKIDKRAQQKNK